MKTHQIAIPFFLFILTGLFYSWNALSYPMVYDDLHLIRSFSNAEIVQSFHGTWDPDNVETPGFRPLTLLFNHVRYELFGENVVAHRFFLIILVALFFTMIVFISTKLETTSWLWATCSGILCIGARYNVVHYVWLSDGIHLVQGVFWGVSVLMLLTALERSNFWLFLGSFTFIGLNLLVREDSIIAIPSIIILGGYFVMYYKPQSKRSFVGYFLMVVVLCIGFFQYRTWVLPEGQETITDLFGFVKHVVYMVSLPGLSFFNSLSKGFVYSWIVTVIGLFFIFISETIKKRNWSSLIWLVSGVAACLSGISVTRVNLLLFPIAFFCIFLCSFASSLAKKSLFGSALAIGIVVLGITSEVYITPIITQNFHPYSSTATVMNVEFIYGNGKAARRSIIPLERKENMVKQLQTVGITSSRNLGSFLKEMIANAIKDGRRTPNGEKFFVPYLRVFNP